MQQEVKCINNFHFKKYENSRNTQRSFKTIKQTDLNQNKTGLVVLILKNKGLDRQNNIYKPADSLDAYQVQIQ